MSINNEEGLSLTTFSRRHKCIRLEFINGELRWDNAQPPYVQHIIPAQNIISVKDNNDNRKNSNGDVRKNIHSFTIHYIEEKRKNTWRTRSLTLGHAEEYQVLLWVDTLRNYLDKNSCNRPKNLLLFINPFGGKKKGLKIYEKKCKRVFELAEINVTIFVTQRQNQIRDKLIEDNLDNFDSIGCIGGDGTVSEVINGLVLRECRTQGVDQNKSVVLPRPALPVGIIPGGSTDTTAYCLYGTTDVTTAVLHIISGSTLGLDLVSVHDTTGFLKVYADVTSYGFLGDIAYHSEKLRWMGPSRYEYTGFKKLLSNTGYSGEVKVLIENTNLATGSKCYRNCNECVIFPKENVKDESLLQKEAYWKSITGKFFMISGANISCAGERNPNGLAPYCHLGDGFMHLLVIYHTSVFNSMLTLNRFTRSSYTTDDLQHVEIHKTREFQFSAGKNRSRWNCDGEVIEQTDIHARVQRQLVTVFSRGFKPPLK